MTLHEEFDPVRFRAKLEEYEQLDHNLLLLRPDATQIASLLSFPVEQEGADKGEYKQAPIPATFEGPGTRKVMGLAREHSFEEPAGPVFATLPVKPEPGSTFFWCYFINSKRLSRRRWTYNEHPTQPPPSLVVAEDSGQLRLYESVGLLEKVGSEACRSALEAGFIVGTMPTSAAYGGEIRGTTAVVNLTPLHDPPGDTEAELPDLAIITPHDDAGNKAKVFLFSGVGDAPGNAPVQVLPASDEYEQLTTLSLLGEGGTFEAGAALSFVQVGEAGDADGPTEPARDALVVSARNLLYKNEWIRADWAAPRLRFMMIGTVQRPTLVVATPDGGLHKYVGGEECLPLARNTDVWHQLRNGCVLGTVQPGRIGGSEQLAALPGSAPNVPLVNLSSLEPEPDITPPGRFDFEGLRSFTGNGLLPRVRPRRIPPRALPVPKTRLSERKP